MALPSRYIVTPSQLTNAGRPKSNPAWPSRSRSESRPKSTGTNVALPAAARALPAAARALPAAGRARRFHSCVAGWSISKTRTRAARGDRLAKESRPAPSRTYWPMPRRMPSARLSSV